MVKKTDEIIQNIKSQNIDAVIYNEDYFLSNEPFYIFIQKRLDFLNIKPAVLIKQIDLDSQNGYKYINGKKKINRNLAIKILISLSYNFDEIQEILKSYQYPILYPKIKRDHIIISAIINEKNIFEINELLSLNNEFLL